MNSRHNHMKEIYLRIFQAQNISHHFDLMPLEWFILIRYACVPVETGHTMQTSFWTNLALRLYWQQGKHTALEFRVLWTNLGRKHETWMVPFWISLEDLFRFNHLLEYFRHYLINEIQDSLTNPLHLVINSVWK